MTGSNWVQLSGGSTNPWNIIRDDGTYTASYGDHVISDGGTVTLPSPQQGAAVAVSEIGNSFVTVDGGSAQVEQRSTLNTNNGNEDEVVFISDGSNWYIANDLDNAVSIPDAQNLYADYNPAKQCGPTPFVDQAGTASDLTANGDPTLQSDVFGSNNGIDLDGSGDFYVGSSTNFGTLSQPYTIYFVFQNDSGTGTGEFALMNAETDNEIIWDGRSGKNDWKFRGTNQHTFGQNTPNYNDIVSVWDGQDSVIEADGSEELSSVDIGSVDLDGFILGQRRDDTRRWDGRLGRVLVYDAGHDSQTRSDVRSFLSDKGWI